MICPNCGETLRERERSGIEIDVCPVCRGMWLDRGELDKLLDRESRYYDNDDDDDLSRDADANGSTQADAGASMTTAGRGATTTNRRSNRRRRVSSRA